MAKHAKHGTPEETKQAKKNLKKRKKKLKRERKRAEKQERKGKGGGRGCLKAFLVVLLLAILLAIALVAALVIRPAFAEPALEAMQPAVEQVEGTIDTVLEMGGFDPVFSKDNAAQDPSSAETETSSTMEASDNAAPIEPEPEPEQEPEPGGKCYLIAQCDGVDIYSPIMQKDITGVLFHQASYEWAQIMTTELPGADLEKIYNDGEYLRVNNEQTEGEWADADIAHLYRETDATPMDTSIDCGAKFGTTVYAPVTGEVVAVMNYDLYDEIPDVQIHIRPDANDDLDVVLLHQYDPQVKVGDHVTAGVTPISYVRDIAKDLTDVQLSFYTEPDDPGNHSHVQVNDFNDKEYLKKYFKGKRPDK